MVASAGAQERIRRLDAGDGEAVAAIYNGAVARGESVYDAPTLSASQARALLFDVPARFESFAWDAGDGIAGWSALLRHHPRKAYETTAELAVYVAPDQRRRGIGRALVAHTLARADALGFHTILLLLQKNPAHLLAWAARLRFRSTGYLAAVLPVGGERRDILAFQRFIEARPGASP